MTLSEISKNHAEIQPLQAHERPQSVCREGEGINLFLREFLCARPKDTGIFLVTGRQSYVDSGAEAFFKQALSGYAVTRFFDFSVNPSLKDLQQGLAVFTSGSYGAIIAAGGGSVLDMAKLINFFGSNKLLPGEVISGKAAPRGPLSLLLAVPTTAGTGSEATHFAALYDGAMKYSIAHPAMLPGHAWLNPEFTLSQSKYQAASCAMDAFAQAIESYWAVGATEQSKADSARAIELCLRNLVPAVNAPSIENRRCMMEAAYLAGRAINISKTTASHALSYALTIHYGLPHGHAVALTLPAVLRANAAITNDEINDQRGLEYVRQTMGELMQLLGVADSASGAALLENIMDKISLSRRWFSEKAVRLEDVRAVMISEVNTERFKNNPRRIAGDSLRLIVESIY